MAAGLLSNLQITLQFVNINQGVSKEAVHPTPFSITKMEYLRLGNLGEKRFM